MTPSTIPPRTPRYRPIEDYGIIGNMTSTALVRLDGSIDWCCLPHMDSSSVFAALLDADRGGYFSVRPANGFQSSQHYVEATNVLVTTFVTDSGRLEVHDFMPTGSSLKLTEPGRARPTIYRQLRCTHGQIEATVVWSPRHDYAGADTTMNRTENGWVAGGGTAPLGLAGLDNARVVDAGDGPALVGQFSLDQGDHRFVFTRFDDPDPHLDPDQAEQALHQTIEAWTDWVGDRRTGTRRPWAKKWEDELVRSELFLKLMAQRPSGALAAAPTTSLPESLGGPRNWDYRFTWVRDAAQIAQAFAAVGHIEEADAFIRYAEHVTCEHDDFADEGLQLMYPLTDDGNLEERTLHHLEGYRGCRPVRVGNAAAKQLQLDIYGELLNAVYERLQLVDRYDADLGPFLVRVLREASRAWHHPDFGIWEMRNGPFHLVYSKMMTWVAFHRGCWLHDQGYLNGDVDVDRWRRQARQIEDQILAHGYDDELDAFAMRFDDPDRRLDAANLLMPMMGFLPADDPRIQATIDRTLQRLTVNDLVFRYRRDDGLAGEEGSFVLCTCWLVDALAMSGRLDEAHRIFENLVSRTNHLGLLAEQIDPYSGEFLGNFPQAYSHVGLINSALYLGSVTGEPLPVTPLMGDAP